MAAQDTLSHLELKILGSGRGGVRGGRSFNCQHTSIQHFFHNTMHDQQSDECQVEIVENPDFL